MDHEFSKNEDLFSSIFVSIIMPVYNRDFCIEKAINSVISQTHQKWSLIIIDDGSHDNTEKIISKYLADSRIKLFKQKRKGVSKSRNQGLSLANHKYIFYLDSDNTWYPRYLF
ncbi:MAG: glycosyltransferase family A protein, partial [Melioribacteraceae bacterium]